MSKKEETEEIIEEVEEKKENKKSTSKKNKDKKETEDIVVLKTLYELIISSPINTLQIISKLDNDYLTQFYDEEDKFYKDEYVEPTLSEEEFKKIIGG